ncbi:hypothetical protein TruAng_003298 [Truncatella angustata]|nr:hypothetical protein TruAng_003298 [Truncatella angustata]
MESDAGMILVMGETGVGKSTFINALKPDSVEIGHRLKSVQSGPQAVQVYLDEEDQNSVTVVDTPGFNDSHRPDSEVLAEVTEYLAAQMKGSARKYLEVFRSLCGDEALSNVMLVTTFWNKVRDDELGDYLRREQELIDDYWEPLQRKGSVIAQFDGSKEAAESLILQLAQHRRPVILDIQRELVDDDKIISETKAGLGISERLDADIREYQEHLEKIVVKLAAAGDENDAVRIKQLETEKKDVEGLIKDLEKSRKRMGSRVGMEMKYRLDREKRKEILVTSVSVFASVLSITLTIVKFVVFGDRQSGLRHHFSAPLVPGGEVIIQETRAMDGQTKLVSRRRHSAVEGPRPDIVDSKHSKHSFRMRNLIKPLRGLNKTNGGDKTHSSENSVSDAVVNPEDLDPLQMTPEDDLNPQSASAAGSAAGEANKLSISRVLTDPVLDRRDFNNQSKAYSHDTPYPNIRSKDQARLQDFTNCQVMPIVSARTDSSYAVKAVAEILTGPDILGPMGIDGQDLGSNPRKGSIIVTEELFSKGYLPGQHYHQSNTGSTTIHQTSIISANSREHDTTITIAEDVRGTFSDRESNFRNQGKALKIFEKTVVDRLGEEIEDLKFQNQESKSTITSMKQMEAYYESRILELEEANGWLQHKVSERAVPAGRQTIPGIGLLPDSDITGRWRQLCWTMRQLVSSNIVVLSSYPDQQDNRFAILKKITPTYTVFLRSKSDFVDLVQAVIWDHLANNVFASRNCSSWACWSGKCFDQLKALTDSISHGHRQDGHFHLWRSQTATLFSMYADPTEVSGYAQELVGHIEKDLKYLLNNWDTGLRKHMANLVGEAIQFDADLCQQRAWWFCEYPGVTDRRNRYDIPFQSVSMKEANSKFDEADAHATLMISPALMKAGNSTGDNYDNVQVVVESSVHRGKPRLLASKPPPATSQALVVARQPPGNPGAYQTALRDKRKAQRNEGDHKRRDKIFRRIGIQ